MHAELTRCLSTDVAALHLTHAAAVESLWQHDLSFVVERVVAQRVLPRKIAEAALVEYRKFMTLRLLDDADMPMLSAEVDEIWHAHLLHTRDYAEFCERAFGCFVHHDPIDPAESAPAASNGGSDSSTSFFAAYRELFGTPSYLWNAPQA